jgi:hypothetical protein
MSKQSKDTRATSDRKLAAGIQKLDAKSPPLVLRGKTMTIAEIISMLESRGTAAAAVVTAKAAFQAAVAAERTLVQQTKPYVDALRKYLVAVKGNAPETLAEYGIAERKPRVLTSEQLAQKASKARATRKAHAIQQGVKPQPAASPAPAPPPPPGGK